ncbi:MAG: cytochrome o ubiquinol oxidase subunit I [Chlamydiales bacterium]|nr:cytochrome o ubiquinol oxidase subunit I [Chlamydiales bacterium]
MSNELYSTLFGRLTLHAFKHDAIQTGASVSVVLGLVFFVALLFYTKRWKWLWREWLTSLDPKKIGIMYLLVAIVMLLKGVSDAVLMRFQQVTALGGAEGLLTADHFQQIFTAHGTTMIFFVGMGSIFALMNWIIPLQIGARDVAFPFLNSVSYWLFAAGAMLLMGSMIIGDFSATGWVAYPPLSGLKYSPGEGVDYWIWSVQIAGIGSLLAGINFFATIFKMRCPGMTFMKMPVFVWSMLGCLVLILFAFPILTATLGLLTLDRYLGMHFFTPDMGGNPMMYINLIWAWGHPEVYILILPAFGVFSELVATFSQKRIFAYASMVWAIGIIVFLSFIVWAHHFFTMGAGANVNAFFGVMTMLIAIPTGVKIFNWLFTMYRGRILFTTPVVWFLGFVLTFSVGGMAGVLMSIAPVDFQVHNSLFLIAHFHSVIIGGVLFGVFAAITYWFPKMTGFKLNEKWGMYASISWIVGFLLAFLPLYILGLMGATRRLDHYDPSTGWFPLFAIAGVGVALVSLGIGFQLLQLYVSIKERKQNLDTTGDPWNGRTLEWATSSPPPLYNFAITPQVSDHDSYWYDKLNKPTNPEEPRYEDIHMPKNSPAGIIIGGFGLTLCFALVWYITWLAIVSLVGAVICLIVRLCNDDYEYTIPAHEVERAEMELSKRGGQ